MGLLTLKKCIYLPFPHRNPNKGVIINHVSAVLLNYLLFPFNRDNISVTLSLDKWPKCVSWSSSRLH